MRQWQLRMKRITDAFAGTNYPSRPDRIRGNAAGHAFLAANLFLYYNSGISASNLLAANERIDKIENWFFNVFTPRSEARLDRQADIFQDEYNNLVGLVVGAWAQNRNMPTGSIDDVIIHLEHGGFLAVRVPVSGSQDSVTLPGQTVTEALLDSLFPNGQVSQIAARPDAEPTFSSQFQSMESLGGWEVDQDGAIQFLPSRSAPSLQNVAFGTTLGALFGSMLGDFLFDGDSFGDRISAAILNDVGARMGAALGAFIAAGDTVGGVAAAMVEATDALSTDFAQTLGGAAIGVASSYLTVELSEALGIKGFGAEMFSTGTGKLLAHTLNNVVADLHIFDGVNPQADWFKRDGLTSDGASALGYALAAFLGAKLGSLIVQPNTQAAVVLSTVGAAAGAYVGIGVSTGQWAIWGAKAFSWGGFVGAAIGAFIGFVVGALFGNLFGRKKPRVPTANAEVVLQIPNAEYALGTVSQANGGNIDLVRAMGEAARDTLNGLISVVTYGDENARVSNTFSPTQVYGHTGGQLWVKLGGASAPATNVNSADEAVDKGVLYALPATQIIGGDMWLKRALYNMARHPGQVTSVAQLSGDLTIADQYGFYLQNRSIIDAMIAEPYTSMKLASVDYLAYVRADVARLNAYKAAYPAGSKDAYPDAKNFAQIRSWGKTQWDALAPATQTSLLSTNPAWTIAANADTAFYDANKAFMTRANTTHISKVSMSVLRCHAEVC